jgi:hypothetical protein
MLCTYRKRAQNAQFAKIRGKIFHFFSGPMKTNEMLNYFHKVIALVVLCCAGLLYGGAEAAPRLDCENNADDGLLCYDKLEGT